MSNIVLTKPFFDVVGGVVVPVTTLADLNLRVDPFTSPGIAQNTHLGKGVYQFINVPNGNYKLFNGSDEVVSAGIIKVGEIDAVLKTGDQTIAGIKTFTGAIVFEAGIQTDTIIEKTSGAGVTIDGILLKDSLTTSGIAGVNINNTFTGENIFEGIVQVPAAADDGEAVNLAQLNDAVSAITTNPFQESSNKRRVFTGATTEANKVYGNIADAIASCISPSAARQYIIEVVGTGTGGQYISVNGNLLANFVHIKGEGRHIGIIITTATSLTKTVTFENCSIYLGANVIADARTFASFTFINCDIYAWRDTTFNNCKKMDNCNIFHASGYKAILAGTTFMLGSKFNQVLTDSRTEGNQKGIFWDGLDESYDLGTDPTIPA